MHRMFGGPGNLLLIDYNSRLSVSRIRTHVYISDPRAVTELVPTASLGVNSPRLLFGLDSHGRGQLNGTKVITTSGESA